MTQQQVFSDRYEMIKHIARGGMAQVYLARDLLLDRPVALKVLFPELSVDRAFVERFRREAKAAANLSHPNIVSIYDWGQGERTYFIVMEYIDGSTLSALMRHGPLDAAQAATIGVEVAAALEFAHQRGVIHRDVKPGNVLIENATGRAKVTDFGIARAIGTSEDLTQTGSVMGTATYFSPEQAQGMAVDARSDVYSLGVVLYEMVTGRAPFTGDSPVSIAYKHVKENPPLPSELNPAVPEAYEAIVMQALSKDPSERYQTADALRADLLRFSAGEQVAAEPTRVGPAVGALAADATATMSLSADGTRVMGRRDATMTLPPGSSPGGPPPPGEEPHRRRGWLWALLVLLLIALGVGLFFLGKSRGWWDSGKTLTIPSSVIGKTEAAAKTELTGLGFTHVTTQNQQSSQPKGIVVNTNPPPNTSHKASDPVTLVVSSGPAQVVVPASLIGEPATAAEASLQGLGLHSTTTSQPSSSVPTGYVISTNPPTGSSVAPGSTVALVVSSGKQPVTIPPLVGESPTAAGQILGALGLVPSQQPEPSTSVPSGSVTRTSPPAGTQVLAGTTVIVYVSTGPPQVGVPDLTGQTKAQAQSTLSAGGLTGSFTTQPVTNQSQNGKVISQSPSPGSSVAKGSTVTVVIGSYTAPTTTTSTPTSTTSSTLPLGG